MAEAVTTTDKVNSAVIGGIIAGVSILVVSILVVIVIVKKKQMKNKLKIGVMEPSKVTGNMLHVHVC